MRSYPFTLRSSARSRLRAPRIWVFCGQRTVERVPTRRLRLQEVVDEEFSARRAKRLTRVLSNDPDAQKFEVEYSRLKSLLVDNEFHPKVPQTRARYWRGILRAISEQQCASRLQQSAEPKKVHGFRDHQP
jgi:hypothetical protein